MGQISIALKSLRAVAPSAVLIFSGQVAFASQGAAQQHQTVSRIMALDENTLKDRALGLLGLRTDSNVRATLTDVPAVRAVIPSLKDEPVWRIQLDNVKLFLKDGNARRRNTYVTSVELLFSERTGQIVRLMTEWPVDIPGNRFPDMQCYLKSMSSTGQKFLGIPDIAPRVSLEDALSLATIHGSASLAKQIVVYYVVEAYPERKIAPRPVWIVHCWGIPPFRRLKPGEPSSHSESLTHFRVVINAETGEWLYGDNLPNPQL